MVLGVAIGAIAGLGAVVFYEALRLCTHFFLQVLAGYQVPTRRRRPRRRLRALRAAVGASPGRLRRSAARSAIGLPLRARGRRTRHRRRDLRRAPRSPRRALPRRVRQDRRVGAHDRLRWLGRARRADRSDQRRVRLVAGTGARPRARRRAHRGGDGIGSGIGAIFGAPLGGAVLAAEILYRDDFESSACCPVSSRRRGLRRFGIGRGVRAPLRLRRQLPLQ